MSLSFFLIVCLVLVEEKAAPDSWASSGTIGALLASFCCLSPGDHG